MNEIVNENVNGGRARDGISPGRTETGTLAGTFTGTSDASIRAWRSTSNPPGPSRSPHRCRHGSRCRSARRQDSSVSAGPRRTRWHTAVDSRPSGSAVASSSRSIVWRNCLVPTSLPSARPSVAVLRHDRAPRGAAGSVPDPGPKGNPKIGEHVCNLPAERLRPRSRTGGVTDGVPTNDGRRVRRLPRGHRPRSGRRPSRCGPRLLRQSWRDAAPMGRSVRATPRSRRLGRVKGLQGHLRTRRRRRPRHPASASPTPSVREWNWSSAPTSRWPSSA